MEFNSIKRFALAAAILLWPSFGWAQCNGVFPNNTLCGNVSGANNLPRPVANSVLTGVPGGTSGQIQYNNGGTTFGGISQVDVPRGGTGQASFTANLPLIGNGSSALSQGTRSGNTTSFATTTGSLPSGNCVKFDASGNLVDGGACAAGGIYILPSTYGAKCDGITNDATALQNMITANAGKVIYIPGGTCLTNSTLTMPSDTTIIGGGREVSILKSTANPALTATDKSNIYLANFQILGTDSVVSWASASYGPIAILQDSSSVATGHDYTIRGMKFAGFNTTYWVVISAGGSPNLLTNITFEDNYIVSTSADIPTDGTASNNTNYGFIAISGSGGNGRIDNTIVRNNRIDATGFCHGITLFNNNYKVMVHDNLILNPGNTTIGHCTNVGGTANNSYGILVYDINGDGNPPTNQSIIGNTIISPVSAGIYMVGDGTGGHTSAVYNTSQSIVANNLIVGQTATDDTTLPRGAIVLNLLTDIQVVGNQLYSNYGGIAASGQMTGTINIVSNSCSTGNGSANAFCVSLNSGANGSSNTDRRVVKSNYFETTTASTSTIRSQSATGARFSDVDIINNTINPATTGINFANQFVTGLLTIASNEIDGPGTTMFNVGGLTGSLAIRDNQLYATGSGAVGIDFSALPAAVNGSNVYITNAAAGSSPCSGSSTGAMAFRQNGAWKCF